jgi:hypothetical protein
MDSTLQYLKEILIIKHELSDINEILFLELRRDELMKEFAGIVSNFCSQ